MKEGCTNMNERSYCVYIMASMSKVLYIGVTGDLPRRVWEHKSGVQEGFTKRYRVHRLVYFEQSGSVVGAIEREKQLKRWRREKKIHLIESLNPEWRDLSEGL